MTSWSLRTTEHYRSAEDDRINGHHHNRLVVGSSPTSPTTQFPRPEGDAPDRQQTQIGKKPVKRPAPARTMAEEMTGRDERSRTRLWRESNQSLSARGIPAGKTVAEGRDWGGIFVDTANCARQRPRYRASAAAKPRKVKDYSDGRKKAAASRIGLQDCGPIGKAPACAGAVTVASCGPVPSMIAANVRGGMNGSGVKRPMCLSTLPSAPRSRRTKRGPMTTWSIAEPIKGPCCRENYGRPRRAPCAGKGARG
jgi:hypothetical protein